MEYLEEKMKHAEPGFNRNLIFEDYWMSYVDHTVGVELHWNSNQRKSTEIEMAQGLIQELCQ